MLPLFLLIACAIIVVPRASDFVLADDVSPQPGTIRVTPDARSAAASAQVHYHILRAHTDAGARAQLDSPKAIQRAGALQTAAGGGALAVVPSPGFYPAQLFNSRGRTIQTTTFHNVYLQCADGSCWGNPLGFEKDLVKSRFLHLVDQYVGSTTNNRYAVGSEMAMGAVASNCISPSMCTANDLKAIALAASASGGAGPGHIYHIFLPTGVDTCAGVLGCYSPDDPMTFTFCGYHASANSGGKTTYFTVEPFEDVPGCAVVANDPSVQLADSTDSVLSHEIFETLTDPDGDAWFNVNSLNEFGSEIGDECQGPPDLNTGNAFVPPVVVNGRTYRIQLEYSNKYRACAASP